MVFYTKIQQETPASPASCGWRYPCYADRETMAYSDYLLKITVNEPQGPEKSPDDLMLPQKTGTCRFFKSLGWQMTIPNLTMD